MNLIKTKQSPNHFNGRKDGTGKLWKADMIVCHQSGNDSLSKSLSWYLNPGAQCSPNYLIDVNGDIYELVSPDNAAWCNGTATDPNDSKYYGYSLSDIVKSRKNNCNLYSVSIEFVHCQWGNINEQQKTAAVELILNIIIPYMKSNGVTPRIDRQHVIGHSEVTPKTRDPEKCNCPGKQFPFDEIIARVNSDEISPETSHDDVQMIYQAVSTAAVRAGMSKNAKIYSRITKGNYYPVDRKYKINGEVWLRHAGTDSYSMLNDGGALFRKVAAYSTKRTMYALNVRSEASVKSAKVATLPVKTIVYMWGGQPPVYVDGFHWVRIIYEGKICWVASEYLK